mgnify:CR=1 FL=1
MRQAQSRPRYFAQAPPRPPVGRSGWSRAWADERRYEPAPVHLIGPNPLLGLIVGVFSAAWFLLTLPFRLVRGTISLLGRLTGIAIGFTLMVVGMALCAGPFFLIGGPLFLIGLLLTLRCLG